VWLPKVESQIPLWALNLSPMSVIRYVQFVCRSESFVQALRVCLLTIHTTSVFHTQARIDLDQKDINDLLDAGNFKDAQAMYEQGSHSKSISTVAVADGLPVDITQGTNLTGTNEAGEEVRLFAQGSNYTADAEEISVQYKDEGCYVGASTDPDTSGCTYKFFTEDGNIRHFVVSLSLLTFSSLFFLTSS
jgi:hypothetical protein